MRGTKNAQQVRWDFNEYELARLPKSG